MRLNQALVFVSATLTHAEGERQARKSESHESVVDRLAGENPVQL